MISARNYAAQAEASLRAHIPDLLRNNLHQEAAIHQAVADLIAKAQHFAMPDNADMFDDQLRGLQGIQPRLPFPLTTVEYRCEDDPNLPPGLVPARKRVVLGMEIKPKDVEWFKSLGVQWPGGVSDSTLLIIGLFTDSDKWRLAPMGWLVAADWSVDGLDEKVAVTYRSLDPKLDSIPQEGVAGKMVVLRREIADQMIAELGAENGLKHMAHDIGGEVRALMEFCEACACSNIKPDILVPANINKNARRLRDGKLPIYETKVLSVDMGQDEPRDRYQRIDGVPTRSGPRLHLRRGHVRRLSDDKRIWINSMTVGKAERGKIDKQYKVGV